MDDDAVRADLRHAYDVVHECDSWIKPVRRVLTGVSAEQAEWKPAPDTASIWEIVDHMTTWTKNAASRLADRPTDASADWPGHDQRDAAAWRESLAALSAAMDALRVEVSRIGAEALFATPSPRKRHTRFRVLINVLIHNAYHAGQIAKVKAMYRMHRRTQSG